MASPIPLVLPGAGGDEVIVVDAKTGDPLRRVELPVQAAPGGVFAAMVNGAPIVGVTVAGPLRILLF